LTASSLTLSTLNPIRFSAVSLEGPHWFGWRHRMQHVVLQNLLCCLTSMAITFRHGPSMWCESRLGKIRFFRSRCADERDVDGLAVVSARSTRIQETPEQDRERIGARSVSSSFVSSSFVRCSPIPDLRHVTKSPSVVQTRGPGIASCSSFGILAAPMAAGVKTRKKSEI